MQIKEKMTVSYYRKKYKCEKEDCEIKSKKSHPLSTGNPISTRAQQQCKINYSYTEQMINRTRKLEEVSKKIYATVRKN